MIDYETSPTFASWWAFANGTNPSLLSQHGVVLFEGNTKGILEASLVDAVVVSFSVIGQVGFSVVRIPLLGFLGSGDGAQLANAHMAVLGVWVV